MSRHNTDLPQYTSGLVEHAELPKDRPTSIVNPFTGQTIVGVKGVHAAKRELDSSPRRWKTTPAAEVCAANHDFNENGVLCRMSALDRDLEVRQCPHQLLVKQTDSVPTRIVFAPRLIIVACGFTEGAENAFKIVVVLQANVLLNNRDAS